MPDPVLIDWSQAVQRQGTTGDVHQVVEFAALVSPVLVQRPRTLRIITQTGEAVAWFGRYQPPAALFPDALVDRPQIAVERIDDMAWRATWQYTMAVADDEWADASAFEAWLLAACQWPTVIDFMADEEEEEE